MRYMRPRFDELELGFMLEILKEVQTTTSREVLNLEEEQEHLRLSVYSLRHRFLFEDPYGVYKTLNREKETLKELEYVWLPIRRKETVILSRLIVRLQKALQHRRGRIPSTVLDSFYNSYLEEIVPKNT